MDWKLKKRYEALYLFLHSINYQTNYTTNYYIISWRIHFFVFSENLLLLLLLWSPYWSAHLLITFCSLKKKEFQNNRCQIVKYILKRAQIPTCLSKSGLSAPEAASFKHICSDEY